MKSEKIQDAIGMVDEKLVVRAEESGKKSRKLGRKRWAALIAAVLVVAVGMSSFCLVSFESESSFGAVTHISAKKKSNSEMELEIAYTWPTGGYSVRNVPEDEGEYVGDGMKDYDGSLGKYRIIIKFGDIEPSMALALQLSINEIIKESPVTLRARIAHPSDHGFVLYIGSDTPISVETVNRGKLKPYGGTIKIPITIENE